MSAVWPQGLVETREIIPCGDNASNCWPFLSHVWLVLAFPVCQDCLPKRDVGQGEWREHKDPVVKGVKRHLAIRRGLPSTSVEPSPMWHSARKDNCLQLRR